MFARENRLPQRMGAGHGAALALLCLAVLWPGYAAADTLTDTLVKTYSTNPTLKAAQAELRTVNEQVPQELSNWRPGIDVQAAGQAGSRRTRDDDDSSSDFKSFGDYNVQFQVNQFLFRGGRTVAGTRRAKANVSAQRSRLSTTEQDVFFDAIGAYSDVWRDQEILGLNDQNVQALRDQRQATLDRFALRDVTDTDVQQSESRLARAIADRATSQQNLISSRSVYKQVVGEMPGDLEAPPRGEGLPESLEETIELAVENFPDVVAAVFDERAERQSVRVEFGGLLPEISVLGNVSQRKRTLGDEEHIEDASVLGQVRMPLYERGLVSSRIREAKERANQRRIQIEEQRRAAEQGAIDAWEALQTALARITAFEAEVEATRIALEGTKEESTVGARTILDILDAEQEFLDARVNLVGAKRDEIVATYQVLQAVGLLTASNLALDTEIYNPEVDYEDVKDRWYGFGELPYISEW